MCRLRYFSISHNIGWRLAGFVALVFLILGSISFGYGMKIMEYAENKDVTPVFAGLPMLLSGVLGGGASLSRKKSLVTCFAISSTIVLTLSIHMNYKFMVKEYYSLPLYKQQCKEEKHANNQHFCINYTGTIMLCGVSVAMVPAAFGALLACFLCYQALKEKCLCLPGFTFSKVEPTVRKPRYGNSREQFATGIPHYEPDLMELELPSPSDPAYRDFIANEFGLSVKSAYRKSLKELEIGLEEKFNLRKEGRERREKREQEKINMETSMENMRLIGLNCGHIETRKSKINMIESSSNEVTSHRCRLNGISEEEFNAQFVMNSATAEKLGFTNNIEKTSTDLKKHHTKNVQPTDEFSDKGSRSVDEGNDNLYSERHNKCEHGLTAEKNDRKSLDKRTATAHDWVLISNLKENSNNVQEYFPSHMVENSLPYTVKRYLSETNDEYPSNEWEIVSNEGNNPSNSSMKQQSYSMVENSPKENTPVGFMTPSSQQRSTGGQLYFDFDQSLIDMNDSPEPIAMGTVAVNDREDWVDFECEENQKIKLMLK